MVYTSVLKHGGIVMQCANGSTYPGGPAHTSLLIGLSCYDILTNQTEQDLKGLGRRFKVEKGLAKRVEVEVLGEEPGQVSSDCAPPSPVSSELVTKPVD
jgi:hypothetical protein